MKRIADPNQMSFALSAQMFLSHFLVMFLGSLVYGALDGLKPVSQIIFTGVAAGILGLLFNLNLQRGLRVLDWALLRLTAVLPVTDLPQRGTGPLAGMVAKMQILAERERPFADLRERQLQQASEAAVQETRNRLARDLHDSIKQQLFSINISAAAVQARLAQDTQGALAALDDVRGSAKAALVEMNALLQQLSPEPLAKVGLVKALQEQCEALEYRTGAKVNVIISDLPDDEQFPLGAQEALFRMAQEALSNVARHARAGQVELRLEIGDWRLETKSPQSLVSSLLLEIKDDGQGFEATAVSPGMGLQNMRQRVQELGGQLQVTSAPLKGTTVQIVMPLEDIIIEAKEIEMHKPDQALNRFSLIGLGGGLALSAVLFYPLYVLLPGMFIEGWLGGTAILGIIFSLLALPLTVGIGYMGARQLPLPHRAQAVTAGVVASGIAGLVFYYVIGGVGAAVWGNQILLQHGYTPAQTELEFLYYVAEGTNGTIWAILNGFWLTLGTAVLLGAVGGSFVPLADKEEAARWPALRALLPSITTSAQLSSLLTVVVTAAIFSLLGTQLAIAADEVAAEGFSLSQSPVWSDFWPIVTALVLYLLVLAGTTHILWRNQPQAKAERRDHVLTLYVSAFVTFILPFFIFGIYPATRQFEENYARPVYVVIGMMINLVLGLLIWRRANQSANLFPALWPEGARVAEVVGWLTAVLPFFFLLQDNFQLAALILIVGTIRFVSLNRRDYTLSPMEKAAYRQRILPRAFAVIVGSLLAIALPILSTISVGLNLVLITVPSIAPLNASFDENYIPITYTLIEKVQQAYLLHPVSLAVMLVLATISVSLMVLIVKLSSSWRQS
jgi:signal transduction histidine kinase